MASIDKLRQAVEQAPRGSKAATMRALLPSIERQISQGIHYKDIVEALNQNGFEISQNTFVVTLRRLRKEKKGQKPVESVEPFESHDQYQGDNEGGDIEPPQSEKGVETESSENGDTQDLSKILSSRDRENYADEYLKKRPIGKMGSKRSQEK